MFLTGEFSKIAQVSKRLLRFYDEIGLFQPAQIDPQTGYRYYSARQLPRLNRILVLKELGLSLDEIKHVLDDGISDEEIRSMLVARKGDLERTLAQDMQRLRAIEARLLGARAESELPDVIVKSAPALPYLSTRLVVKDAEQGLIILERALKTLPAQVGKQRLGACTILIHSDGYEVENVDIEMGFLLNAPAELSIALSDDIAFATRELPAVDTLATVVPTGDMASRLESFYALGRWVESSGYQLAGVQREVVLEGVDGGLHGDMVLEIQFPIRASSHLPSSLRDRS